ncbi:MAG: V-type ATPase subunit [Clostridia bacterium]|nr:V-type ATPase subunit [Clostridia bacterium]
MKRINPTEYIYASARMRAIESRLIGRERMEVLIEARSAAEVMDRLAEYGLKPAEETEGMPATGSAVGETVSVAREGMLLAFLKQAFDEVDAAVPDPALFRYFRYPYDCNNIKAAIKCAIRGISPSDMLFDFGTVPADLVETALREGNYRAFSPAMAAAIPVAKDTYDRTGDPRHIDAVLDNACYADMLAAAEAAGDETLLSWVKAKIDLTNILTTLRLLRMSMGAAGETFLDEALLTGGSLDRGFFTKAYAEGEARLWNALSPTAYYRLARVEGDPRPLSAVEKACDDLYVELVREGARIPFGAPVMGGYIVGCETSVKNIRIVLAAKDAGLGTNLLRERVRLSYV